MINIIVTKRRGTVLAFALMALIAILALIVVFFSRAGRHIIAPKTPTVKMETTGTLEMPPPALADDHTSITFPPAPAQVPPPPVLSTPATDDLPPEG